MEDDRSLVDKNDKRLIKILPYLVMICALGGIVNILWSHADSIGGAAVAFCEIFVLGFFFLGLYEFVHKERPAVKSKFPIFFFAVGPFLVALMVYVLGVAVIPDIFESDLFQRTDDVLEDIFVMSARLYAVMILAVLVVFGVVSVVASYFRQYSANVFHFISRLKNDGTDNRKGNFALKFYDIPNVIDIKSVEMEPVENERFSMGEFVSMALSIFLLGLVICSNFFLNPVLMREMSFYEVLMIGVLISFFIPVLVVPWYITKETGAKVKSNSRDFYLWKGMRKRLYQSFFGLTMVLLLVLLTFYLGSDILRLTYTYMGYIAFLAFMSLFYSYVFFNSFSINLRKDIVKKFNEK
jgi:hypothetical protein